MVGLWWLKMFLGCLRWFQWFAVLVATVNFVARIRQLCRAFVVSSNNDAKVPFKQMTKFLGNHHIKSHLKRLWVGERSFVLWKLTYIALYKFSPFQLRFSPFWGNLAYYLAYYCLAGLYPRLSTWQIFLFIENLL